MIRRDLEPPLLQQAAFDDTVCRAILRKTRIDSNCIRLPTQIFRMDIIRNVGIREIVGSAKTTDPSSLVNAKSITKTVSNPQLHRNSLPNLVPKEPEPVRPPARAPATAKIIQPDSVKAGIVCAGADVDDDAVECAVSGRLEIRVVQQQQQQKQQKQQQQKHQQQQQQQKNSPNPEESIYFDAVANANSNMTSTENAPNGNDDQMVPRKSMTKSHCECAPKRSSKETNATAIESVIDGEPQTDDTALHNLRKYFLVTSNDTTTARLAPTASNDSNCSKSLNIDNNGGGGGGGDDNAPDTTFVSAVTTLPKCSQGFDDEAAATAISNALCNANNDSLSNNDNNKENPVVSYASLYNQSTLEQKRLTATALVTTKPPPTPVAAFNQSDGTCSSNASTTTTNQMNNRKDINSSTSCSKIPIFNPTNVRMMKCASWAGSDLPLTPAEMNNLTPGN